MGATRFRSPQHPAQLVGQVFTGRQPADLLSFEQTDPAQLESPGHPAERARHGAAATAAETSRVLRDLAQLRRVAMEAVGKQLGHPRRCQESVDQADSNGVRVVPCHPGVSTLE